MPHRREGVAEQEARALEGAEEVADHREGAALDAGEVERGAARLVDAPLNLGHFEVGIDFRLDADELAGALQIGDTGAEVAVAHRSFTCSVENLASGGR